MNKNIHPQGADFTVGHRGADARSVLAWIDASLVIDQAEGCYSEETMALGHEVRAAVAELLDAVEELLQSHPAAMTYPDGPCIERDQRDQLRAILARCQGTPA